MSNAGASTKCSYVEFTYVKVSSFHVLFSSVPSYFLKIKSAPYLLSLWLTV